MLGSGEPYVPIGGGSFGMIVGGIIVAFLIFRAIRQIALPLLAKIAYLAGITVSVFLRREMGVRAISIKNILIGAAIIYFVGNMIGHNYHDYYRDRNATIWGAVFHFTYLVLFVLTGIWQRFLGRRSQNVQPSSFGESRLATFLENRGVLDSDGAFSCVLLEPLAVLAVGMALVFWNWFGWYLILTACLFLYGNLYWLYRLREAHLNFLDNPPTPEQ